MLDLLHITTRIIITKKKRRAKSKKNISRRRKKGTLNLSFKPARRSWGTISL